MGKFEKVKIRLDSGDIEEAVATEIISVRRSNDIPDFYEDWFLNRL